VQFYLIGILFYEKKFKEKKSLSDVISRCGFIKKIVSFIWISKRVQYSNMVSTFSVNSSKAFYLSLELVKEYNTQVRLVLEMWM
jgi:hypothetical protein